MDRLRRLAGLPWRERVLLAAAALCLAVAKPLLATAGRERTRAVLDRLVRPVPAGVAADRVGWAVRAADTHVPGTRACLARALTAEALLSATGHCGTLHYGVANDGGFAAHAWVERGGEVLVGETEDLGEYRVLTSRQFGP